MNIRMRSWTCPGILFALAVTVTATAAPESPPFSWPDGRRAALSLSFDDARPSQVLTGAALLDRLGLRVTFYVVPSNVELHLDGWLRVVANGHEIGNHTLNHPCSGNFAWSRGKALEDLSLDRLGQEMRDASRRIRELLGVTAESFAYPCGQTFVGRGGQTQSYVPVAAGLFVTSRGWPGEVANDPCRMDLAQVTGIPSDNKDFAQILPLLEAAKASGQWVVLAGHDIGVDGPQTTRVAMLEELARYVSDPTNGVWTAPVGAVARVMMGDSAPGAQVAVNCGSLPAPGHQD